VEKTVARTLCSGQLFPSKRRGLTMASFICLTIPLPARPVCSLVSRHCLRQGGQGGAYALASGLGIDMECLCRPNVECLDGERTFRFASLGGHLRRERDVIRERSEIDNEAARRAGLESVTVPVVFWPERITASLTVTEATGPRTRWSNGKIVPYWPGTPKPVVPYRAPSAPWTSCEFASGLQTSTSPPFAAEPQKKPSAVWMSGCHHGHSSEKE
jgi:hypothetical protein